MGWAGCCSVICTACLSCWRSMVSLLQSCTTWWGTGLSKKVSWRICSLRMAETSCELGLSSSSSCSCLGWLGVNLLSACGDKDGLDMIWLCIPHLAAGCSNHVHGRHSAVSVFNLCSWCCLASWTKQKKWADFRLTCSLLSTVMWSYDRVRAMVVFRLCVLICWSSKTRGN